MKESQYRRLPRQRKFIAAYIGHALLGLICGVMATPPLAAAMIMLGFYEYQKIEFIRFRALRDTMRNGWDAVPDTPSRGIADFLIGATIGMFVGILLWIKPIYWIAEKLM